MTERVSALGIVSCGSLKRELEAVLAQEGGQAKLYFIAPAPCIDYDSMERGLRRVLKRAQEECRRVVVVIGRCHPHIDQIVASFGARRVEMDNCFDALLGGRSRQIVSQVNTFFTTPAWLKQWRRFRAKGVDWDEITFRQNFGVYRRILLLDSGTTPFEDEDVLRLFDETGVEVEVMPIDLSGLAQVLRPHLRSRAAAAASGSF